MVSRVLGLIARVYIALRTWRSVWQKEWQQLSSIMEISGSAFGTVSCPSQMGREGPEVTTLKPSLTRFVSGLIWVKSLQLV